MKRSPLGRGKPMKRSNSKRRKEKFARNFGERSDAVRAMPCLCETALRAWVDNGCQDVEEAPRPCRGDIEATHIDGARGMGGCGADRRAIGPLCSGHAVEAGERRGSKREEFETRYGLDLQAEAKRIAEQLDSEGVP